MANSNSDNLVALFVDYENLIKSYHRQILGYQEEVDQYEVLEWKKILDVVRADTGRIVIKRAYADWVIFKAKQRELLGHGFELVNTPARGDKNAADIKLVIDALSTLRDQDEKIHDFFIVSGDGDFIDLVHHLHAHGKIVRGMGVRDATADNLIKVCDEFVFYDFLVNPPSQQKDIGTEGKPQPVPFELSEARQILREIMEQFEDAGIDAAFLKSCMRKKNPAFNERNYGYPKFKTFLEAQSDIVTIEHESSGRIDVKKVIPNGSIPEDTSPEKLVERYLACLARVKVHMSPTAHRALLIARIYDIIDKKPKISLNGVVEELATIMEKEAPFISYDQVKDSVNQLFLCKCIWRDDETTYPEGTMLWDRAIRIRKGIRDADEFLARCDQELLKNIQRGLDPEEKMAPDIAARILYGKDGNPEKKEYVEKTIKEIETQN